PRPPRPTRSPYTTLFRSGAEAANTEGAIGGLINLRSASPFDSVGMHGIMRVEGDRNQMSELDGTKLSGVYSNTFLNDTLGVMFRSEEHTSELQSPGNLVC